MRQTSIGIVAQTPVIPAAIEDGTRGVRPLGQRAVCARSRTIARIRTPAASAYERGDPKRQSGADRGHLTPYPVVTVSTAPVTGPNQ